jgi:hypothetical protein
MNNQTFAEYSNLAVAGYNRMASAQPPYASSPYGMAFRVGEICRERGIYPHEVQPSRGYTWKVNKLYKINLGPELDRKGTYTLDRI